MVRVSTSLKRLAWTPTKWFGKRYDIDLTHHVYVCGITGMGKTNTVMRILEKYADVPYIVIEPTTSRQYRNLSVSGRKTHIYSIGEDTGETIELNPFYIPYGIDFSSHIELLKACFASAISSKESLVYNYLDRAIPAIYYDKGWDQVSHINERLKQECDYKSSEHYFYFPRMRDLYDKVIELSRYSEFQEGGENKGTLIELLKSNIHVFLEGALGKCFNTYRNDLSDVFNDNIVLELPNSMSMSTVSVLNVLLGSIIQTVGRGTSDKLQHITVFEEAQLLFGADDKMDKGRDDIARKLEHLLSTGRKFGERIIVVNQDPGAIHKSVLGNIRQRLIHRINSNSIEVCKSLATDYNISVEDITSTKKYSVWYRQDGDYKALTHKVLLVETKKHPPIPPASPNYILGYAGLDNINDQLEAALNFLAALSNSGCHKLEVKRFNTTLSQKIKTQCKVETAILPEYMAFLTCAAIGKHHGTLKPGSYNELTTYYTNVIDDAEEGVIPDVLSDKNLLSIKLLESILYG